MSIYLLAKILLLLNFWGLNSNPDSQVAHAVLSPMQTLQAGNERFVNGNSIHPHENLERIRELRKGQHPFVVVVSCSDSRVPPELIFDQGLGDIFSVRTAGNIIGDYELGSIEYAVEHLGCKLVVVLGHEDCGAVKAYLHAGGHYRHKDHIKSLIDHIALEEEERELPEEHRHDLNHAVQANMLHGVHTLLESDPVMRPLCANKQVQVVGALYHMSTGHVTFFDK